MSKLKMFVPIRKIDEEQRLVYGVLAEEAVDKSGEIFDYETSKPLFRAWSDSFKKATAATGQEESLGNLRSMHTAKAAGKFTEVVFNDADKRVEVCAKVVDDQEWEKTKQGVYTGFSIGGDYAKRWADAVIASATRYTAQPAEGSLVDNPCMYGATFTAIKADGSNELRKFSGEAGPTETKSDPPADPPVEEKPVETEPEKTTKDDETDPPKEAAAVPPAAVTEEQVATAVKAQLAPVLDAIAKLATTLGPVVKAIQEGGLAKAAGSHDLTKLEEGVAAIKKAIESLPAPPAGRPIGKTLGDGSGANAPGMDAFVKIADEALAKAAAGGTPQVAIDAMRLSFVAEAMKRI